MIISNSSVIKRNWNLISFIIRKFIPGSSHPEIFCKLDMFYEVSYVMIKGNSLSTKNQKLLFQSGYQAGNTLEFKVWLWNYFPLKLPDL